MMSKIHRTDDREANVGAATPKELTNPGTGESTPAEMLNPSVVYESPKANKNFVVLHLP